MATAQVPRGPAKYDAYLDARLDRARKRVRAADLAASAFGLAAITLGYGLFMLLVDRAVQLPAIARQLGLVAYLGLAGYFVWRRFLQPLSTTINPYYAARQVERTLPGSKNSLVSWLDLKERTLAPSVRDAVGRAAAGEFDQADVDDAVRDPRLGRSASIAGVLAVALVALLCIFRPAQFFSLLARTFSPFTSTAIATQTRISLIEPKGGDVTVPLNYSVDVRIDVEGRVPRVDESDALRLRLRYSADDPVWEEKRLEAAERPGEWAVRVPAGQVRNGFEYQVVGGDAATPIHRVSVRARPLVTDFEARYHYRPYLRMADDIRTEPNLQAVRGTEVTILAKANRPVREGTLRFTPHTGTETIVPGRVVPDRPDVLEYKLVLQTDGRYRLRFVTAEGEASDESLPFDVKVLPDLPPDVNVTKPAPDKVPVNGTLALTTAVTDDYGLSAARLSMSLLASKDAKPEQLPVVPYRGGKPLKSADGTDPRKIEVKDVVALDKMVDVGGHKLELKPGMILVYKYEADDNCDFPKPQTGASKEYRVELTAPQDPQQRDADRKQAEGEKKEQEGGQGNQDQKPGDGPQDQKPGEGQGEQKPGEAGGAGNADDAKTKEQAEKIASALKEQEKGGQGEQKPGDNAQGGESKPGEGGKNEMKPGEQGNQPGENQPKPGDNKQGGESKPGEGAKNEMKPGEHGNQPGENQPKPGDGKPSTQPQNKPDANQNKPGDGAGRDTPPTEPKPDQINQPGGQPDNKNATSPDKSKPKDGPTPAGKTGDTPEQKKPGDKSEKSGEKAGQGAKDDKPNDTDPKTSPDKGNAEGGKAGSQRAGDGANEKKPEKSGDAAMSGKSDPNAGKPEGDKPRGATAEGDKANNQGQQTKPDVGKAKPNPDPNDKTAPQGTEKPDQAHAKPGEKPNAEPKSDGTSAQGDPKNAKPSDKAQAQPGDKATPGDNTPSPENLKKMIDAFQKADPKTQKQILDKLEQMARDSKSQAEKQQIEQACEACKNPGSKPGTGEGPGANKTGADGSAKKPGDSKDKTEQPGAGSNETKTAQQPKAGEPKPGDQPGGQPKPGEQPGDKGRPDPAGNAMAGNKPDPKGDGKPDGQQKPGEGLAQGQPGGEPTTGPNGEKVNAPNEDHLRRAGEMQLDDFRKKVDRKLLDRLKMTDEEYRAFLKSYEEMLKRQQAAAKPGADDRVRGGQAGGSAANTGAKKVAPGTKSGPDTSRAGRGQAPPEFRDQYRDFTAEQAKQDPKKKP